MLTTIFCVVDDFCKQFEKELGKIALTDRRRRKCSNPRMQASEIMTILIYSKIGCYKNFKTFFLSNHEVLKFYFPSLVSYSRFIELQKFVSLPLCVFFKMVGMQECDGMSYIDSTKLSVCHGMRRYSHKTMRKHARSSKTSTGWFYGLKLHLLTNTRGEIIDFVVTKGNIADNNHDLIDRMCKNAHGKIFGDKGYIMKENFLKILSEKHKITFVTSKRRNMKENSIPMIDRYILKHRGVIESTIGILKNSLELEHSRCRSVCGFIINILSTLCAYAFRRNKPSIKSSVNFKKKIAELSSFSVFA